MMANTLPDDPDTRSRLSDETSKAIEAAVDKGEAKVLGRSHYVKDTCWWSVQWGDRFFIFLNEVGDWCWEVTEKGAKEYAEVSS